MEDLLYHVPYMYQTGTRLRVTGVVTEAHAWHTDWTAEATALVGKMVTVMARDELAGYQCNAKGVGSAWFPSCALESAFKAGSTCIIEVPSV